MYWCRWACLAPAFVVGMFTGPLILFLYFHFLNTYKIEFQSSVVFVNSSASAFGVTLICAWVAPTAKYLTAVSAGLLYASMELIYWALESKSVGVLPNYGERIMSEGYVSGIFLALLCLFGLLSRRSISN